MIKIKEIKKGDLVKMDEDYIQMRERDFSPEHHGLFSKYWGVVVKILPYPPRTPVEQRGKPGNETAVVQWTTGPLAGSRCMEPFYSLNVVSKIARTTNIEKVK